MNTFPDFATINMEGESYRILCGETGEPITVIAEDSPEARKLTCAATGKVYEPDYVAQIAVQHAKDELQLALNRQARDAVKGSKMVNFSGKTSNDRTYEFVVDFEGGPVEA